MLLEELWEIGCASVPSDISPKLTMKGFWDVELYFQPHQRERIFASRFLIACTHYQGCCFYNGDPIDRKLLSCLIGRNYKDVKEACLPVKIAVLDSLFGWDVKKASPTRKLVQEGVPSEKAIWRAKIVAEEVQHLVSPPAQVSMLGVSGLIIDHLVRKGYEVSACDLDPSAVGTKIREDITVLDGSYQEECIRNSEATILTGMALTTGTMDDVLKFAREYKTRLVVYAQTGANIAPHYLQYGASTVVCEHMPFYNFEGISRISVWRRQ